MKHTRTAFTIIELLIALTIVSMVLILGLQSYTMILAGKVKLIERAKLQKEAFFFSEKLFQMIKFGGTIDYEEYFNRSVVGSEKIDGHYKKATGFGNFGLDGQVGTDNYGSTADLLFGGLYVCRSLNNTKYASGEGCYKKNSGGDNFASDIKGQKITSIGEGKPQRYWQYAMQFWDRNSNAGNDRGDENGDGNIMFDDDDKDTGNGPIVFDTSMPELYLLGGDKKTRTFFRWNIETDRDAETTPGSKSFIKDKNGTPLQCVPSSLDASDRTGCRGTIQMLKLTGVDWGYNHQPGDSSDPSENDGVIDTWLIDKQFRDDTNCKGTSSGVMNPEDDKYFIAGAFDTEGCWKNIFPSSLNVSNFEIQAFPNKNQELAWITDPDQIVSPYLVVSLEIQPSWAIRKRIRGIINPLRLNTMVNLTDVFSK